MIINTEGIVLRQRKIAGNRRMIVIFTRQYGKISAGTSITERNRSRSALALRPFTFAEYELFKGRDAYSINSASARRSYYSIGEDIDRFMTASSFIEYLDKITAEGEPAPGIYDLALEFLESVSRTSGRAARASAASRKTSALPCALPCRIPTISWLRPTLPQESSGRSP